MFLQYRLSRVFAFSFHVGASIIVFYAARDKKFWLYPLAILLHTVMDTVAALSIFKVITSLFMGVGSLCQP